MIGFCLRGESGIHPILVAIEQNIDAQAWEWVVDQLWMIGPTGDDSKYDRLENRRVSTKELLEAFQDLGHDFVFFGRFRSYPPGAVIQEIEVMQDFLDSECSLILCVIDCHCYELYSKNRDELEKMYTSIFEIKGTEELAIETLENYGRTSFTF